MSKHFNDEFSYGVTEISYDEMKKKAIYDLFVACEKELALKHQVDLTTLMGVLPDMISVIKHKIYENKDKGILGDPHVSALKVLLDPCRRK